jgi:hypothetical protein
VLLGMILFLHLYECEVSRVCQVLLTCSGCFWLGCLFFLLLIGGCRCYVVDHRFHNTDRFLCHLCMRSGTNRDIRIHVSYHDQHKDTLGLNQRVVSDTVGLCLRYKVILETALSAKTGSGHAHRWFLGNLLHIIGRC